MRSPQHGVAARQSLALLARQVELALEIGGSSLELAQLAALLHENRTVLCGLSGVGKSTIINILTRYYDIDSGTILIDGQDISKLTQTSLRRQVGVVLQEAFLFSDTVMNNLKYAREGATD